MEAFAGMYTSDETFQPVRPQLRGSALANASQFSGAELEPFASCVPDLEMRPILRDLV